MYMKLLPIAVLLLQQSFVAAQKRVCVEGFIMDQFCIERKTLLDAGQFETLKNPEQHSVHCLIDVPFCVDSGFSVLLPAPAGSENNYFEAYRFNEEDTQKLVTLGKEHGACTVCKKQTDEFRKKGFRATIVGIEEGERYPKNLTIEAANLSQKWVDPSSTDDGCSAFKDLITTTTPQPTTTTIAPVENTTATVNITVTTTAVPTENTTTTMLPSNNTTTTMVPEANMTTTDNTTVTIPPKATDPVENTTTVAITTTPPSLPTTTQRTIIKTEKRCVEGHIMDRKCIIDTVLLDAPTVKTLENPEVHSVHCLIGVRVCVVSGFSVLLKNEDQNATSAYYEAYELDERGLQMVIEDAKKVGVCRSCDSTGNITKGYRATMYGTATIFSSPPHQLKVEKLKLSPRVWDETVAEDGCENDFGKDEATTTTTPTEAPTTTAIKASPKSTTEPGGSSGQWLQSDLLVSLILPMLSYVLKYLF